MLSVAQVSLDTLARMTADPTISSIIDSDGKAALLEATDFLLQDLPQYPEETMETLTTQPRVDDLLDLTTGYLHKLPMFDCGSLKQSYVNGKVSSSNELKRRIHEKLQLQENRHGSVLQLLLRSSNNDMIYLPRERNMDLSSRKVTDRISSNQEQSVMTKTASTNPQEAMLRPAQINKEDVRHTFEVCQKNVNPSKRNSCRNDTPNQYIHIHHHFYSHPCDTDLECQLHQKSDPRVDLASGTFCKNNHGMSGTISEGVECFPAPERRTNATLVGHDSPLSEATLRLHGQNAVSTASIESGRGVNKRVLQQVQRPIVRDKGMLPLNYNSYKNNVHKVNVSPSDASSRNACTHLKSDTFPATPEKRSILSLQECQASEYAHMYSNYGNGFTSHTQVTTERVSTNMAYNLGQNMPWSGKSHTHVSPMSPYHSNSSQPSSIQGTAKDLQRARASTNLGRRPPPPLIPIDQVYSEQLRPTPYPSPNMRPHHPYKHNPHHQHPSFSNLNQLQNQYPQNYNPTFHGDGTVTPELSESRTTSTNHLQHYPSYPAM